MSTFRIEEIKKQFTPDYIEYVVKREASKPRVTRFEKFCKIFGKIGFEPPKSIKQKLYLDLLFSGIRAVPKEVFSFAVYSFLFSIIFSFFLYFFLPDLGLLLFLFPFIVFYLVLSYPSFMRQVKKVQGGDEAIKIILYMIIYLKINPTLEGAISFAAKHVNGILGKDFKEIAWGIESGKYRSLTEAFQHFMPKWVMWNEDFVRALSLLSTFSYVTDENEREMIFKRSLNYILERTFIRTKSYVEEIISPINIIYMFGLVMPAVALVMFPMISIFLHETVKPGYIILGYLFILPTVNYYFIQRILMKRPSAFIQPDISKHPDLPPEGYFRISLFGKKLYMPVLPFTLLIGLIIMSYGIMHIADLYISLHTASDYLIKQEILKRENSITFEGIFSSFSFVFGFALMLYLTFYLRSFQRVEIRKRIKEIEDDLPNILTTLANSLAHGVPLEKGIEKNLEEYERLGMKNRVGYRFFREVLDRIRKLGFTLEKALFDKEYGVLKHYPSKIMEETMRILLTTVGKSSMLLGKIARTISDYFKNIKEIELRIKELLVDVRTGLRMQASIIVPAITGAVSSLGIFILNMLKILSDKLAEIEKSFGLLTLSSASNSFSDLMNALVGDMTKVMPMTIFQIVVGLYTFIAITLMSYLLAGIENGFDKVMRDKEIAENIKKGMLVYFATSTLSLIIYKTVVLPMIGGI